MTLVPWKKREVRLNRLPEFDTLHDEMHHLFDFPLVHWGHTDMEAIGGGWIPSVDMRELKNDILVKADIPGMKKEEIEVSVCNNTLFIKGERRHETKTKENGVICTERQYGSFERMLQLPAGVREDKVVATYKDGVLELVLPKTEEGTMKRRKIEIK